MKRADETAAQRLFRLVTGRTPDVLTRDTAAKVRELRAARPKASDADLARELRVSRRTLKRWEQGTQAPRGRNAGRLDRELRKSMTERPTKGFREGGKLSFKARVTIGSETRNRTFNLPLSEADRARLAQAAAARDPAQAQAAINRVLGPMIAAYIGQSKNYPVTVHNVTQNFVLE